MNASYHRHDISDEMWALLEPHLPGQRGQWGGIAQDNRRFINAVFWVLRTGAHGVTFLRITGNEEPYISALSAGVGKASGKNCWIS